MCVCEIHPYDGGAVAREQRVVVVRGRRRRGTVAGAHAIVGEERFLFVVHPFLPAE